MSRFLESFVQVSLANPEKVAFENTRGESVTYGDLNRQSDFLAAYFNQNAPAKKPVVVYGHKSPLMLAAFMGAVKSGRAYSPVDIAYPADRVNDILLQIDQPLLLDLSDGGFPGDASLAQTMLSKEDVADIFASGMDVSSVGPDSYVNGEDVFYLLFTSGSTGRPKGVQMPSECVDAFMDYYQTLVPQDGKQRSFNRVPYTFDVSLFDIIPGLSSGATLIALEQESEKDMASMFDALKKMDMTVWISTPSYIEMCLADPSFSQEMLPDLQVIILCGEVFRNATGDKLLKRFPKARTLNTYGPTETQAVSDIVLTQELVDTINPLPVGYMNPTVKALILNPDTLEELPVGQEGEVYLMGSTVSLGYWGRSDLTEKAFSVREDADGKKWRCYKTGDKGYLDEEGRLYCLGRLDFQVKLNGFRVELGDIEQHIDRKSVV